MRAILGASLLVLTTTASASPTAPTLRAPRTAAVGDLVGVRRGDVDFVRKLVPATTAAVAQSRIIYLNHTGVTLRPGDDDSRVNTSSIINSQVQVPAWNTSATKWAATVACFEDMWKDFDVTITDQDPGNVPHIEAVFGGSPQNIGMPSGVGGVSPFTQNCGIIENSIVFTFTNVFPDDPQTVCEVMSQEVAHSYGLDHEMLASDPMTYLDYNGNRTFKDQLVSCGEYSNRACGIGGSVCRNGQNSVALLKQRLGVADRVPPTLEITSPTDGATVAAGFEVTATASDDRGVTMATLFVDDVEVDTLPGPGPYVFATDATLPEGAHTVRVDVTDGKNIQSDGVAVTIQVGGGNGGGNGSGDGNGTDGGTTPEISGGCSTSGSGAGAWLLGLALLALRRRSPR